MVGGGEGEGKNEKVSDVGGGGSKCSGSSFFILFYFIFNFKVKKIGFAPWPDIMLTLYYWQEIFHLALMSDREAIL